MYEQTHLRRRSGFARPTGQSGGRRNSGQRLAQGGAVATVAPGTCSAKVPGVAAEVPGGLQVDHNLVTGRRLVEQSPLVAEQAVDVDTGQVGKADPEQLRDDHSP
ncbi:hypothetical protein [Nonomuraea sp. SBT364]|uniref:hypothetical protein n=1 Tax=Nonomuraea sp. SBT364 TaxID=1580530 RepID=UPI0012E230A4|nr:hypothetical protein [Nonomuraea sp. SBT364]